MRIFFWVEWFFFSFQFDEEKYVQAQMHKIVVTCCGNK